MNVRATLAAFTSLLVLCGCGRKASAVTPPPSTDASTTQIEWTAEQSRHARGMLLRRTGVGKNSYKLQSDGCVRVTFRPSSATVILRGGAMTSEGEGGVTPALGPICGLRGDEWFVEASPETAWALWATDADQ